MHMALTINFDDETSLVTKKVRDVWADRVLPAKLVAAEFPPTEMLPQGILGFSRPTPHCSGAREDFGIGSALDNATANFLR